VKTKKLEHRPIVLAAPIVDQEYVWSCLISPTTSDPKEQRIPSDDISADPEAEGLTKILQTLWRSRVGLWIKNGKSKVAFLKHAITSNLTEQMKPQHKAALFELTRGIEPRSSIEDSVS